MKKVKWVEEVLQQLSDQESRGISAQEIAQICKIDRSTASRYLNELVKQDRARKIAGRPVRYLPLFSNQKQEGHPYWMKQFHSMIGMDHHLQTTLEEAIAALLYPPHGLPILLTGETGVGKSYLASVLHQVAIQNKQIDASAPFVPFNCAEYAQNPELLLAQLFGVQRGAYTGAQADKAGLVEQADGGILFLDEIHRLSPAGQEMLFYLIDQGRFRRLGETEDHRQVKVRLIAATTELPETALLPTLARRFSVKLRLSPLRERSRSEREHYLRFFLEEEAKKMNVPLQMAPEAISALTQYDCPGNIGQLRSDIQIACARAFLRHIYQPQEKVVVQFADLPRPLRETGPVSTAVQTFFTSKTPSPEERRPNIYEKLTYKKQTLIARKIDQSLIEQELQSEVNRYIQTLIHSVQRPQDFHGIEPKLLNMIQSVSHAQKRFITKSQLFALCLHLQAFLQKSSAPTIEHSLPALPETEPLYQEWALQIASRFTQEFGIQLPEREIALISLFLSAQKKEKKKKERLIATVCLTGEGTAVSLEYWLKEKLPPEDQDVVIQSVHVDPVSRQSLMLYHLKENYQLIAVVGTVPPALDEEFIYIPAWELYQPQGFQRLNKCLSATRSQHEEQKEEITFEQVPDLVLKGLSETVTHYNPRRFVQIIQSEMISFREMFAWDAEREVGLWMHLGIYTDRLIQEYKEPPPSARVDEENEVPSTHVFLWEKLLKRLEQTFMVTYPLSTAKELSRLSAAQI